MTIRTALIALVFVCHLGLAAEASANDGTPPRIFEVIQNGKDVEVNIRIWENGEPDLSGVFKLIREAGEGVLTLFDNRVFSAEEAAFIDDPTCRWESPMAMVCSDYVDTDSDTDIDETPPPHCDDCDDDGWYECYGACEPGQDDAMECIPCANGGCSLDCDGDGQADCPAGWCQQAHDFKVVDPCVEPGDYLYQLYYHSSGGDLVQTYWGDESEDPGTITVVEAEGECADTDIDTATDTDNGDTTQENGADSSGCSVTGVGGPGPLRAPFVQLCRTLFALL